MDERFARTRMLLGAEAMEKLARSRVAVFGLGGVGGYAAEALARSGVGALDLIDNDKVALSNLNRQIIATGETLGMWKTDVARARIQSIHPACEVRTYRTFYLPGETEEFDFSRFDCVVDAIDTVTGKIGLILEAQAAGKPVISAMGTGNKLDPSRLRISDIYETSGCPLARIMRRELRRRGVEHLPVVWSDEPPLKPLEPVPPEDRGQRRDVPGSTAFVPAAAGLLLASWAVRKLTGFM